MGFTIGGATAWKVCAKGDVALAFHWVKGEPSMVFYPARGRTVMAQKPVPYVLPIQSAHELVKDGSNGAIVDADALWAKARTASLVMGYGEDFQIARTVADLMLNHLDDLCDMPPEPAVIAAARQPAPTGELAVTVDGETVFQGEA